MSGFEPMTCGFGALLCNQLSNKYCKKCNHVRIASLQRIHLAKEIISIVGLFRSKKRIKDGYYCPSPNTSIENCQKHAIIKICDTSSDSPRKFLRTNIVNADFWPSRLVSFLYAHEILFTFLTSVTFE